MLGLLIRPNRGDIVEERVVIYFNIGFLYLSVVAEKAHGEKLNCNSDS